MVVRSRNAATTIRRFVVSRFGSIPGKFVDSMKRDNFNDRILVGFWVAFALGIFSLILKAIGYK